MERRFTVRYTCHVSFGREPRGNLRHLRGARAGAAGGGRAPAPPAAAARRRNP